MSILSRLFGSPAPEPAPEPEERPIGLLDFSTHLAPNPERIREEAVRRIMDAAPTGGAQGVAMDGNGDFAARFKGLNVSGIPDALYGWFVSQTFIGHQMAAMVAQHWLVDKACEMPAKDAVRKGFTVNLEGLPEDQQENVHKLINKASKKYRVNRKMREWVHKGRVFGIRIAIFKVRATDPKYYEFPFNPDTVTPGSFEGIVEVDPYWCTPELATAGLSDPTSSDYAEPLYWVIQGKRYHRSHLAIFRTSVPADILRPVYMYGGIPLPQLIMERIYAAERTANEAPQLAMTKRLTVWTTDVPTMLQNQEKADRHLTNFVVFRDNYGVKINNEGDNMEQFDTTLTGLKDIIDGQYEIVSAIARVPVTKLMGLSPPGGLDGSGAYQEASYHEELETIQEDLSDFLDAYFVRVLRSDVEPQSRITPGTLEAHVDWEPLDSPTAKEQAETNKLKAETDVALSNIGAIMGGESRDRIRKEKDSGFFGIKDDLLLDDPEGALERATQELGVLGGGSNALPDDDEDA